MRTIIKILMVVGILAVSFGATYACETESISQKVSTNEDCSKSWNELWSEAKEGNIEARQGLFFLMAPPPDMKAMLLPGNSGDLVTTYRDLIVMSVHSQSYKATVDNTYRELSNNLYIGAGFDKSIQGRKFLDCVEKENEDCVDIAIKQNLVPSFYNYAKYMDVLIKNGNRVSCTR